MYFEYLTFENGLWSLRLRKFWHGGVVLYAHHGIQLQMRREFSSVLDGWRYAKSLLK